MDEDYTPPWKKEGVPVLNGHLPHLKPRADKRNPALDELIERKREDAKKRRPSGHSLIR